MTHNLTVQYDRVMFLLEPNDVTRGLARKRVTVYDFPNGRVEIRHNWPAAGLMDTEIRCFMEPEVADATTEVFAGV
ncbi:hypothetical protein MHY1_p00275 (plasmid) [Methylovirgula sp. HY1]|nr:hypothetical protein MHY1_p00275 [Methylovirgula sp. HY1]